MAKYQSVSDNIHRSLTPAEIAKQFEVEANPRCNLFCEQLKSLLENKESLLYKDLIKAARSGRCTFSINVLYYGYNDYIPLIDKEMEVTSCCRKKMTTRRVRDPTYVTTYELIKYHMYLGKSLESHFPSIEESTYKIRWDGKCNILIKF
jgi:hypothetical protein